MKVTEKADRPGFCAVCGNPIYVGDTIIKYKIGSTPVAAHAACDENFKVEGSGV